jgi:hypothetical protein
MKADIERTAQSAREAGQTIEINNNLPYVAIDCNQGDEYFFQGDDAENLLDEAEKASMKFDVSVEDYLLHIVQGW